jgi:hypothetical protein
LTNYRKVRIYLILIGCFWHYFFDFANSLYIFFADFTLFCVVYNIWVMAFPLSDIVLFADFPIFFCDLLFFQVTMTVTVQSIFFVMMSNVVKQHVEYFSIILCFCICFYFPKMGYENVFSINCHFLKRKNGT